MLCQTRGSKNRHVMLTDSFSYNEDPSHLLARHLVSSVDNARALESLNEIRGQGFDLAAEDLTTLDSRLMKVFLEMKLPRDWNVLGEDYNLPGNWFPFHHIEFDFMMVIVRDTLNMYLVAVGISWTLLSRNLRHLGKLNYI